MTIWAHHEGLDKSTEFLIPRLDHLGIFLPRHDFPYHSAVLLVFHIFQLAVELTDMLRGQPERSTTISDTLYSRIESNQTLRNLRLLGIFRMLFENGFNLF